MMTVMVSDLVQPTDEIRAMCVQIVRTLDDVHAIVSENVVFAD